MQMPAHRRQTEMGDAAFFAALARGESVRMAASATGYSRQALYQRRIGDDVFAQRWREAMANGQQRCRDDVPRKWQGFTRPVFAVRGKRMSDGQMLARLKAVIPGRYREAGTGAGRPRSDGDIAG
jgi:hypothetical protein